MLNGLLGKKIGMTQVFNEDGVRFPVTVIQAGPVTIIQKKTTEKEGYEAVQVGFDELNEAKARKVNKSILGHLGENKATRHLHEFAVSDINGVEVGQSFDVSIFEKGQVVDVSGTSKGRGFAGVVKRHNFGGGPQSHGHRRFKRSTGSIGQSATPSRVMKNKKMPGHYGNARVTVQNLEIIEIRPEMGVILVKGAIPGPSGRLVEIKKAAKG